jgi:hypothetical protein
MKINILLSVVLVVGVVILVRLAIVGKNQQKLLRKWELARTSFHMTDAEIAVGGKNGKDFFEGIKRQDEASAVMAFTALVELERGDIEQTKKTLETGISIYYRGHHDDGNSNLLRNVEIFAAKNTSLSNAIYKGSE